MSAQETGTKRVADLTETISSSLTSLLAETISSNLNSLLTDLIRTNPPQAPPPPPSPDNNINKEILRELQSLNPEIESIRSDLHSVKVNTDSERKAAQKKLIDGTNLLDLLDLSDTDNPEKPEIMPAEKHNELARRYNSKLRDYHSFLAPLLNPRGNRVFGFPTTVGDLLNLSNTAEELLYGAFGLKYQRDSPVLKKFCGFDPDDIFIQDATGSELAATRVYNRHRRATDLEAAGEPTASTRTAAAHYNANARRHNARAGSCFDEIMPIHDERNLPVPGFPTEYGWFDTPYRRDVLYLLREYGQDVEPEGCLQRFGAFVGVPISRPGDREKEVEWHM